MSGERFKAGLRILGTSVLILALAGCAPEQTTPPNPNDENGDGSNNLSFPGTDVHQSPLADPESIETPSLAPQEKTPTATVEATQPAAIPVADGNPTEVLDEDELVDVKKDWRDLIAPLDFSPGSELVAELKRLGVDSWTGSGDPLSDHPEMKGKLVQVSRTTYVQGVVRHVEDGVPQIIILGVEGNPDGTFAQIQYVGAIDAGANGGIAIPFIWGPVFDEMFRGSDRVVDPAKLTLDALMTYYERMIGTTINTSTPHWRSADPFDPFIFARGLQALDAGDSGISGYSIYDGIFTYALEQCPSEDMCNSKDPQSSPLPRLPRAITERSVLTP